MWVKKDKVGGKGSGVEKNCVEGRGLRGAENVSYEN